VRVAFSIPTFDGMGPIFAIFFARVDAEVGADEKLVEINDDVDATADEEEEEPEVKEKAEIDVDATEGRGAIIRGSIIPGPKSDKAELFCVICAFCGTIGSSK